jgi:hypothetical protein
MNKPIKNLNNCLGCQKCFKIHNNKFIETDLNKCEFICGVANAWGIERLCPNCEKNLKIKWAIEDLNNKEIKTPKFEKLNNLEIKNPNLKELKIKGIKTPNINLLERGLKIE